MRKFIITRAKALGLSSKIPSNWNPDGTVGDSSSSSGSSSSSSSSSSSNKPAFLNKSKSGK